MKTVKITTNNKVEIIDVDFNDFRSIQRAINGSFETVKTQKMWEYFKQPIMFIGDEEAHCKGLPINRFGSWLYDTERHGWPIAGDIIFAVPDGENIFGLDNAEAIKKRLLEDFGYLEEERHE